MQMEQITQIILIILIAIKAQSYMLLTLLYIDLEMSVVLKLTNSPSFFPVSFRSVISWEKKTSVQNYNNLL